MTCVNFPHSFRPPANSSDYYQIRNPNSEILPSDLRLLISDLSFPYALSHLFDTLCALRSAPCDFYSQQSWLFQFLQCSFICCMVSEALPKVFPDGTNLLHLPIWVKAKCFFTSPLCFRLYKGLLLQVVELLARDPDFTYDFRCCLHNKRPAMRKIWGH